MLRIVCGLAVLCVGSVNLLVAGGPAHAAEGDGASSLQLNEILASNRSGILDEDNATSDWIELCNRSDTPIRLDGYKLTDNRAAGEAWSLPDDYIPARGYYLIWMSGTNRISMAPEALRQSAGTLAFQKTIIPPGAEWKYAVPSPDDAAATRGWTAADFDDSAFQLAPAGFGYGDEDDATPLPPGSTVVLLRHEFTVQDTRTAGMLVLQVDFDDGFVAYLNGVRVASVNAGPEDPGADTRATAGHEAGAPERFDLSQHAGLLRSGRNVLAVAGLNTHASSSDMSINPALGLLPPVAHASFRLSKSGGSLSLIAPDGTVADEVKYPKQAADQSLGRAAGDPDRWGYFLHPTPRAANTGSQHPEPVRSRVTFAPAPGAASAGTLVRIRHKSSVPVEVRYTTDGAVPTVSSPPFSAPVAVEKTTVLRAATFLDGQRASPVVSATYLAGERPALPVLSVSMNPADFETVHLNVSASGRSGERPGFFELIEPSGKRAVATGFGLRLHGGAGRRGGIEKKKSYRAYFRKLYGVGRVEYPVIPEAGLKKFDKLVFRSSSNDGRPHGTYIRDQVIRDLHRDMGALSSAGSWYVLLVNGKNHGVYNVVERMDEDFFEAHLGPGPYDVMKTGNTLLSGTREGWDELKRFVDDNDLSDDAKYRELSERVDIENFTSYVILNLWARNFDWPHNNWYAARRVPDGKWIFLCWDAEWGFAGGPSNDPNADPYAFLDSGGAYGSGLTRTMLLGLLANDGYCDYYQREVKRHLAGALSPENALRQIRRHRDAIALDTEREFEALGVDKKRWHDRVAQVEDFAAKCGASFQRFTDEYMSYRPAPGGDDRVAVVDDADGSRHIVYGAAGGQLHELASGSDGSKWTDTAITTLAGAPPAAGRPVAWSIGINDRHVVYRDQAGQLHELSLTTDDAGQQTWQHGRLMAELNLPAAASDPSAIVVDGMPQVFFVDTRGRMHRFWLADGRWQHQNLPVAPRPASDLFVSQSPGAMHVTYRTMFGAPCELRLALSQGPGTVAGWSHRLIYRLPAEGRPVGFQQAGQRRIVFRAAKEWPLHEPFVFFGPDYRGPDYSGPRGVLVQAWSAGDRFWRLEPIAAKKHEVAGDPCVVVDSQRDRTWIAYSDHAGFLYESTPGESGWQHTDITSQAGAAPVAGNPAGGFSAKSGARYYVYRGRDRHIHQVVFDGSWKYRDLTTAAAE